MTLDRYFNADFQKKFYVREWRHALAILRYEFADEFNDIYSVLSEFELRKRNIVAGGGAKSNVSGYIDNQLYELGWSEKKFDTTVTIDGVDHETPTHKIDCVKGRVALDIEWNNKTEFYDRDLNNFRLLHSLGAISVAIIVTRHSGLQKDVFKPLGIGQKYGASTTHYDKLVPKIEGGGAGGCPILVFAVQTGAYVDDA